LQPRLDAFGDDYFHDIEPKKNVGIAEQAQPGEAAAGNSFPFFPIDGIEGPAKILPASGFDLHENQGIAIAADEIDLPTRPTAKITRQDFVAVPAKEFAS